MAELLAQKSAMVALDVEIKAQLVKINTPDNF